MWVSISLSAECPESQLWVCQCMSYELLPCCRLLSSLRYRGGSQEMLYSRPKTSAPYVHSNPMAAYVGSKKWCFGEISSCILSILCSLKRSIYWRTSSLFFSLASERQKMTLLFLLSIEMSKDHLKRSLITVSSSEASKWF
jgi:hypothetical protein